MGKGEYVVFFYFDALTLRAMDSTVPIYNARPTPPQSHAIGHLDSKLS
jgi:hypothetical protein